MAHAAHFAVVLVACGLTMLLLTRARWTWHAPRAAIVCWQATGLALGLAAIGLPLALGLAPYDAPPALAALRFAGDLLGADLPGGLGAGHLLAVAAAVLVAARLLWVTPASLVRSVRARRRHGQLLALVGRADPAAPGAVVLDHPSAAAYCLPGLRPTVVVSAGTLDLLDPAELAAVLSHERAHAAERHDLVLLPFRALCQAVPRLRWLRAARDAVALLVEMRADDRARRQVTAGRLAAALQRFATAPVAGVPQGALGVAAGVTDQEVQARVRRLLERRRRGAWLSGAVALAVGVVLAAVPVGLFVHPW